jgi:Fibronectin type III domain
MTVRKLVVVQPAVLTVVLMMVCHMEAANLQLAWDPSLSPVAGYKVYYGLSSGDYDTVVDVGNQTSYSVSSLKSGQRYYFTVTAYDSSRNESPFADEVSGIPAGSSSKSQGPVAAYTFDEGSGSAVSDASGAGNHGTVPLWGDGSQSIENGSAFGAMDRRRAGRGRDGTHAAGERYAFASSPMAHHRESQPGTSYHPAPSDPPDTESSSGSASQQLVSEWVEVGEVEVDQHGKRVELRKSFVDPIVVAKALSHQEPEPVAVQLRDIDDSGFEIRLQPRNERTHAPATVGYLVMERGSYRLADGTLLEGGIVEAGTTDDLTRIAFGQRFSARPVVMTAIVSGHEAKVVSGRPTMISNGGFRYRLETSSHHTSMDMPVSLAYVAWEPSWGTIDGLTFEVKRVSHVPYDLSHTIWFEEIFEATPVFLADVQGPADRGILGVRWEGKNFEGVMISIDPPPPPSPGTTQMPPVIGYIAIEEASRN